MTNESGTNAPVEPHEVYVTVWDTPHVIEPGERFALMATAPDCEVTVRAVDKEKQTPIKGARVVMHPYRALTDDSGIARVRVAKGQYDILVSGSHYLPVCTRVEITADTTTSAELDADQPWAPPDEDFS